MKLFSVRNGQKFAHFMQVSFSFTCMQEAHIQIGLFLPSHPPREEAEISSVRKSPKATPTSQADAVTHTPVAKSQSRSIYYPPPSPVFQCVSRLGPVGEARLFCQNCLPCPPPSPSFTSAALGPGLQMLACLGKFRDKMSPTTSNQLGQNYLC